MFYSVYISEWGESSKWSHANKRCELGIWKWRYCIYEWCQDINSLIVEAIICLTVSRQYLGQPW